MPEGKEIDLLNAFGLRKHLHHSPFQSGSLIVSVQESQPQSRLRAITPALGGILLEVERSVGSFWGSELRSESTKCSSQPSIQHCISGTPERKKVHGTCKRL